MNNHASAAVGNAFLKKKTGGGDICEELDNITCFPYKFLKLMFSLVVISSVAGVIIQLFLKYQNMQKGFICRYTILLHVI